MNNGQKMFHDFFMSMVIEGKEQEAETLLATGFQKQSEGTFNQEFLSSVMAQYFALIRPECHEQLKKAMAQFASKL